MSDHGFTHLDPLGRARMVDVTPKEATHRRAKARCRVYMKPETASAVARGAITKGDVLAVARVAGIQAAKRTADLIPLCHPIALTRVAVELSTEPATADAPPAVRCTATVECEGRTGVEMEALTSVQIGLLTVYDMCKAIDRAMVIGDIRLLEKHGGQSGSFVAGS